MYQRINIKVSNVNDKVILDINGTALEMGYRDAFTISHWLRTNAKQAKRFAQDLSQIFTASAILEDAEAVDKMGKYGKFVE